MRIMDAEVPSQRWALPQDTDYDRYYNEFELWVNEHYDMQGQCIMGRHMTWEECFEDEWLFDDFMAERRAALYE